MAIAILFILLVFAYFLYLHKKSRGIFTGTKSVQETLPSQFLNNDFKKEPTKKSIDSLTVKTRKVPRKTYLSGFLRGKYWGEMIIPYNAQQGHEALFDFHIYEAEVFIEPCETCCCITLLKEECSGLHTEAEGKFFLQGNTRFPRERLPHLLPINIRRDDSEYAVNIHDPELSEVRFISRLHQTKDKEVFGTVEANITGYLLDFIEEEYIEPDLPEESVITPVEFNRYIAPNINKAATGKTLSYTSVRRNTYRNYDVNDGCVASAVGILVIVVWAAFLIILLPQTSIVLPFIIVPLLFRLIPSAAWKFFAGILCIVICIGFFASISGMFRTHNVYHPVPVVQNNNTMDAENQPQINDTTIGHYLSWKSYDGKSYKGKIWVRRADLKAASQFKNTLKVNGDTRQSYDEMVYRLKEQDEHHLTGVYQLFDSIRNTEPLSQDKFAELIVSFVQHIPYAVVLPEACNASLYSDQFIRNYLATSDARCDGNERFGINTPTEFMASLKGDCDTRTLLLYTILSHYKYDVALLSSEYYNHSLIGINLPYNGTAFVSGAQRYILWETTADGAMPGILPEEISNLNYWRISLKSQ